MNIIGRSIVEVLIMNIIGRSIVEVEMYYIYIIYIVLQLWLKKNRFKSHLFLYNRNTANMYWFLTKLAINRFF